MKKFVLMVATLWLFGYLAGADTPPLVMVLEVRGLQPLAAEAEQVAAALAFPVAQEEVLQQIGKLLMVPDLAGLDLARTVRVFVFQKTATSAEPLPPASEGPAGPPVVISLPVKDDGQAYLDALSRTLKPVEEVDGMEHFQADPAAPAPGPLQEVFVLRMPERLLMGFDRVLVRDTAKDLHEGRLPETNLPVDGSLAVSVPCRQNVIALEPLVDRLALPAPPAGEQPAMDVQRVLRAELNGIFRLVKQVEQILVGVQADQGKLRLNTRLEAAPGSVLERVFGELRSPVPELFTLFPEDALFADVGFVSVPEELLDAYLEVIGEMYKAMGPPWDRMLPVLREVVDAIRGQIVGDYAIGLLPGTGDLPVNMIQVTAVRDPERIKMAMDKMVRALQDLKAEEAETTIGMTVDIGETREYEGVTITPYRYAFQMLGAKALELPPFLAKWLKEMTFEVAFVDGKMLYAWGPEGAMNGVIDRLRNPANPLHQATACAQLLPDLPAGAVNVGWLRLMEVVRAFIRAVPDAPAWLTDALPSSPVALAGYAVVDGRSYVSTVRLALSDLGELARFFRAVAAQLAPAGSSTPGQTPDEEFIFGEDIGVEDIPLEGLDEKE